MSVRDAGESACGDGSLTDENGHGQEDQKEADGVDEIGQETVSHLVPEKSQGAQNDGGLGLVLEDDIRRAVSVW